MNRNISRDEVIHAVQEIKHPAIDRSLMDLGILKDLSITDDSIEVLFAFPFPGIPIKDRLINSVLEKLEPFERPVNVKTSTMTPIELQNFLDMESKAWKGL